MRHSQEPELQWLEDALGGLITVALQLVLLPAAVAFGVLIWLVKALGQATAGVGGAPQRPVGRRAGDKSSS